MCLCGVEEAAPLGPGDNGAGQTELRQAKQQKQLQAAVLVVYIYTHVFLYFFMEEILGLKTAPNIVDLWAERKLNCSKTKQNRHSHRRCFAGFLLAFVSKM